MTFSAFADQLIQLLAISFLKTSAILGIALLLARLLHRSSASLRHWLLNLTLIATLLLPLLSTISPAWSLAILPSTTSAAGGLSDRTTIFYAPQIKRGDVVKADTSGSTSEKTSQSAAVSSTKEVVKNAVPAPMIDFSPVLLQLTWTEVLLIWLSGIIVLLTRWLVQFRSILNATRRAITADSQWNHLLCEEAQLLRIKRRVRLVFSSEVDIPMTWGLLRPLIVLPSAISAQSSLNSIPFYLFADSTKPGQFQDGYCSHFCA